jgi:hypothetical protein
LGAGGGVAGGLEAGVVGEFFEGVGEVGFKVGRVVDEVRDDGGLDAVGEDAAGRDRVLPAYSASIASMAALPSGVPSMTWRAKLPGVSAVPAIDCSTAWRWRATACWAFCAERAMPCRAAFVRQSARALTASSHSAPNLAVRSSDWRARLARGSV